MADARVTDLALNRMLGLRAAPAGSGAVLEMAEAELLLNHLGTIHAGALFALAEASSAAFLLDELPQIAEGTFAALRSSETKFRRPGRGRLRSVAKFEEGDAAAVATELAGRGRAIVAVGVELMDEEGALVMSGRFGWFLQKGEKRD